MNWKYVYSALGIMTGVIVIACNTSGKNPPIPCRQPLTYQIGDIDQRFDISKEELRKNMQKVEQLWKTALNKKVLQYRKDGTVKINLVYSSNQQRTNQEQKMAQRIERVKLQVSNQKDQRKNLRKSYKQKKKRYQQANDTYKQAVQRYNAKITSWKNQGVDPKDKKKQIKEMKQRLDNLKSTAKRKRQNAELMRKRLNNKTKRLNNLIKRSGKVIDKYNKKFSKSHKFNQGKFIKKNNNQRINIYEFSNKAELRAVLTHEAGHALGIKHVDNPKSVMYYLMGKQDIFDLKLTQEDKSALQKICDN